MFFGILYLTPLDQRIIRHMVQKGIFDPKSLSFWLSDHLIIGKNEITNIFIVDNCWFNGRLQNFTVRLLRKNF